VLFFLLTNFFWNTDDTDRMDEHGFFILRSRINSRLPARAGADGNDARLNDKVGQAVGQV
jgi:hypothetical protein